MSPVKHAAKLALNRHILFQQCRNHLPHKSLLALGVPPDYLYQELQPRISFQGQKPVQERLP